MLDATDREDECKISSLESMSSFSGWETNFGKLGVLCLTLILHVNVQIIEVDHQRTAWEEHFFGKAQIKFDGFIVW